MSLEFYRESPGKFDSRTLNRTTLNRWTGRTHTIIDAICRSAAGAPSRRATASVYLSLSLSLSVYIYIYIYIYMYIIYIYICYSVVVYLMLYRCPKQACRCLCLNKEVFIDIVGIFRKDAIVYHIIIVCCII